MNFLSDYFQPDQYPPRYRILHGDICGNLNTNNNNELFYKFTTDEDLTGFPFSVTPNTLDFQLYIDNNAIYSGNLASLLFYWNETLDSLKIRNYSTRDNNWGTVQNSSDDQLTDFKKQLQRFRNYGFAVYRPLKLVAKFVSPTDIQIIFPDNYPEITTLLQGGDKISLHFTSTGFFKRYYVNDTLECIDFSNDLCNNILPAMRTRYPITNMPNGLILDSGTVYRSDWNTYLKDPNIANTSRNFLTFCESISLDNRYTDNGQHPIKFIVKYNPSKTELVSCKWFRVGIGKNITKSQNSLHDYYEFQQNTSSLIYTTHNIPAPFIHFFNGKAYSDNSNNYTLISTDNGQEKSYLSGFYNDTTNSVFAGINLVQKTAKIYPLSTLPKKMLLSFWFWGESSYLDDLLVPFISIVNESSDISNNNIGVVVEDNKFVFDVSGSVMLVPGQTYIFDVSDSSNQNHPLTFSSSSTGIVTTGTTTTNGTAGEDGASVTFTAPYDSDKIYLYCVNHGIDMGSLYNPIIVTRDTFLSIRMGINGNLDFYSSAKMDVCGNIDPNSTTISSNQNLCDKKWHHIFVLINSDNNDNSDGMNSDGMNSDGMNSDGMNSDASKYYVELWIDGKITHWGLLSGIKKDNCVFSVSVGGLTSQKFEFYLDDLQIIDLTDYNRLEKLTGNHDLSYLIANVSLHVTTRYDYQDFLQLLYNSILSKQSTDSGLTSISRNGDPVLTTSELTTNNTETNISSPRIIFYQLWMDRRMNIKMDNLSRVTAINNYWNDNNIHPLGSIYFAYQYGFVINPFSSLSDIQAIINNIGDYDIIDDSNFSDDFKALRFYVYGGLVTNPQIETVLFYNSVNDSLISRNLSNILQISLGSGVFPCIYQSDVSGNQNIRIKLSQDLASSIQPGYRVFLDYINTDIGSFLVDTVDSSGNVYFKNN